jgi:hypothetical protein
MVFYWLYLRTKLKWIRGAGRTKIELVVRICSPCVETHSAIPAGKHEGKISLSLP